MRRCGQVERFEVNKTGSRHSERLVPVYVHWVFLFHKEKVKYGYRFVFVLVGLYIISALRVRPSITLYIIQVQHV